MGVATGSTTISTSFDVPANIEAGASTIEVVANGIPSAASAITVQTSATPPGAFGKTAPSNGASNVASNPTLSWGASSNATSYEYCIDTNNNSACDTSWTSTGTSTSVGLSGLTPSTTYYWLVRATNGGGTTLADGGTWWSFTTAPASPPGAFNKTRPANNATGLTKSVKLAWSASSGATSYEYCVNTAASCTTWTNAGAVTSVQKSGLATKTKYYWQVRARNTTGTTEANGAGVFWTFNTR
jgi:hypothetical protein